MDVCEFKATLGYNRWIQSQRETEAVVVHTFSSNTWESHAFNPNTWKVETGVKFLGGERSIRREKTGAQDSL